MYNVRCIFSWGWVVGGISYGDGRVAIGYDGAVGYAYRCVGWCCIIRLPLLWFGLLYGSYAAGLEYPLPRIDCAWTF